VVKGDALVVEDENCLGTYLYAEDLQPMNLDFVFMSHTNAPSTARLFLDAGARHVIGCSAGPTSPQLATFTTAFYSYLWVKDSTVRDSFSKAQHDVASQFGDASAFELHAGREDDAYPVYGQFSAGQPTFKDEQALPVSTGRVVGYEMQRQQLIESFLVRSAPLRLMQIDGEAGIGKSSLGVATVNYVLERELISGGCIYLDCSAIHCLTELHRQVVSHIEGDLATDGSDQRKFLQIQ